MTLRDSFRRVVRTVISKVDGPNEFIAFARAILLELFRNLEVLLYFTNWVLRALRGF